MSILFQDCIAFCPLHVKITEKPGGWGFTKICRVKIESPHARSRREDQNLLYTTPEEFENVALFHRLDLPSTLIRHEKGSFRNSSSNRRNLKKMALRFSAGRKHFKTERSLPTRMGLRNNHDISPPEFYSNTDQN